MKVEKEVTIYVESFIDALEIVDKMNISLPHAVIFMNEEEFFKGKCHVIIDKTIFIFFPVYNLFRPVLKEYARDFLDWDAKEKEKDK